MDIYEEIPGKTQMAEDHTGGRIMPARKQDAAMDIIQVEACPEDFQPARHPINYCEFHFFLVLFTITELF